MIPNVNDGTDNAPALRTDLHLGSVWDLPPASDGPRGHQDAIYEAIAAAGYTGVQGGDPRRCAELGLGCTTFGVLQTPGTLGDQAKLWRDLGFQCATLHLGTGFESDHVARALIDEVFAATADTGLPMYIETHRATITQDFWRTVALVTDYPDLRFNGDFSHWYTGLEMTYGDFDAKLAFIQPVLDRTVFMHGRIGDSCCIQIDLTADDDPPSAAHFRQLWTGAMRGFLATAGPGDQFIFCPELLPPVINYARTVPGPDGTRVEEGDRWHDALRMTEIARECWAAANELGNMTRTTTFDYDASRHDPPSVALRDQLPSAPRIAPLDADTDANEMDQLDQAVRDIIEMSRAMGGGAPLNIFTTMARHGRALTDVVALGATFLVAGNLPARTREIAILRVARNTRCEYEYAQHRVIGGQAGLTIDEIERLADTSAGLVGDWSDDDQVVVEMVDQLCDQDRVNDAAWTLLAGRYDDRDLIEMVLLVGYYRMIAGFLNAAGVQLEEGLTGWPPPP